MFGTLPHDHSDASLGPHSRQSFSASCDAADHGMLLFRMLHEIAHGPVRNMREQGNDALPMLLYVDALSAHAAVAATSIKIPAERSLLSHAQFLRELLDNRVLRAIIWQDTRDMLSDALAKRSVDRRLIHALMDGEAMCSHECNIWEPMLAK